MRIVHLKWLDSSSSHGWQECRDFDDALSEVHTVGFLIDFDLDKYTLALSYDPETDSANCLMTIPTKSITEITEVCMMTLT